MFSHQLGCRLCGFSLFLFILIHFYYPAVVAVVRIWFLLQVKRERRIQLISGLSADPHCCSEALKQKKTFVVNLWGSKRFQKYANRAVSAPLSAWSSSNFYLTHLDLTFGLRFNNEINKEMSHFFSYLRMVFMPVADDCEDWFHDKKGVDPSHHHQQLVDVVWRSLLVVVMCVILTGGVIWVHMQT